MEETILAHHFDLVTPDGFIEKIDLVDKRHANAHLKIENISPLFIGHQIEEELISFNLKSVLAQVGINGFSREFHFEKEKKTAQVTVELTALSELGAAMLSFLTPGAYIGKLFAADERRRVRDPDYLMRMFGRCDGRGRPLLSLGGLEGGGSLILEKVDGYAIAYLSLRDGVVVNEPSVYSFLPTLALALCQNAPNLRQLLQLHHSWVAGAPRLIRENQVLLVRTEPLHVRTVYGRIVEHLLPKGFHHIAANVLQPDTTASGDIYELYGSSETAINDIPIEFYTLEPYREHVFFTDRDQLIASLEDPKSLFDAFKTAPLPEKHLAATFVVKGSQLKALKSEDWIVRDPKKHEFPGLAHPSRQALLAEKYIEGQPSYPFLKAIEEGIITSQGILLSRYLPTPLLKRVLLGTEVQKCMKRIYFQKASASHDRYFSIEDRAMLLDLAKFGIPVYWVDDDTQKVLQYTIKPDKDTGLFVPIPLVETFRKATVFGVYGSNLIEGHFEQELFALMQGLLAMQENLNHPLLGKGIPIALLTGGGPGAMEVGNRVAKKVGILSCGNIVDFRGSDKKKVVNEQKQNPYIDAKMTYRLEQLVERQAEFHLDFPIFFPGGIGMDFEYSLEEVVRKTGASAPNPILLFGEPEYWSRKVTSRFKLNRETGTIKGSEWISNCFYCIQTAHQGLLIYRRFFENNLPIGKEGPIYDDGFFIVK